jgi:hypothetical protein
MGNKLTGLIDGDTVAFIAAAAAQGVLETEGGFLEPFARRPDGEAIVDNTIHWLKTKLGLTDLKVFLSCPAEENWRLGIDPEYKANRKSSVRPLLLTPLKEYLRRAFDADHLAFLEADDAIGVYATSKELIEGDRIIIGLGQGLPDDPRDTLPVPGPGPASGAKRPRDHRRGGHQVALCPGPRR